MNEQMIETPVFDAAADEAAAIIESDAQRETVEIDGELYFADTGEFAGFPKGSAYLPDELQSLEDCELFMDRLLQAEAIAKAERLRLDAIIANAQKMVNKLDSKPAWLRRVFGPQAEAIVFNSLPRKKDGTLKSKTWVCPYGSIAFKSTNASVKTADEQSAIDYARRNGYDACIKTEVSFLISNLPSDVKADFIDNPTVAKSCGFEINPPKTSVIIKTGI